MEFLRKFPEMGKHAAIGRCTTNGIELKAIMLWKHVLVWEGYEIGHATKVFIHSPVQRCVLIDGKYCLSISIHCCVRWMATSIVPAL